MLPKITVIGNLGKDPETRQLPNGKSVCSFSVAQAGRKDDPPTWFTVNVFGKQAESCQKYLAKGKRVYVEGQFQARKYEDRNNTTQTMLVINADDVVFLSPTESERGSEPARAPTGRQPAHRQEEFFDDDIPF